MWGLLCACKCNWYTLFHFHFQWGLYLHVSPAQHGGHGWGDHGSARTAVAEQDHVPGLPTIPRTGNKTVILPKRHKHNNYGRFSTSINGSNIQLRYWKRQIPQLCWSTPCSKSILIRQIFSKLKHEMYWKSTFVCIVFCSLSLLHPYFSFSLNIHMYIVKYSLMHPLSLSLFICLTVYVYAILELTSFNTLYSLLDNNFVWSFRSRTKSLI